MGESSYFPLRLPVLSMNCGCGVEELISFHFRFFSGAFVGLLAAPMIALGDTDDVGRRTGMYMTVLATGAIAGPPISGAINAATGGYEMVGVYAGESRLTHGRHAFAEFLNAIRNDGRTIGNCHVGCSVHGSRKFLGEVLINLSLWDA